MIRSCKPGDAKAIVRIYNHYVLHTTVTFDENPLPEEEMIQRIEKSTNRYPWFVYEREDNLLGYTYASGWREKSAYRYSMESTIYLKQDAIGKGIGSDLYRELLSSLKQQSCHCVFGVIALPNETSVKFHEKFGFKKVGHLSQVGRKFDQWIDVGYWQLTL